MIYKRFARFGLKLHPKKTQLIDFRGPAIRPSDIKRESFTFLGFTHYWGRTRQGKDVVKKKTSSKGLTKSLQSLRQWCKRHRHRSLKDQHKVLSVKLIGHYNYYGVTGNYLSLKRFFETARRIWHKWLARRNQKGMTWTRYIRILEGYPLPKPRVTQSIYLKAANP